MGIGKYFGTLWKLFAKITLTLFIISVIIYGLDITVSQPETNKKTIYSHLQNERSTHHYFALNDSVCFLVNTAEAEGEEVLMIRSYTRNHIPFCFFCGWNRDTYGYEGGVHLYEPHMYGDLIYTQEAYEYEDGEFPLNSYQTYNTKTGESSYVKDLTEIAPDADSDKYRVREADLLENYGLLSFYQSESCQIAFAVIFVLTAGLILGAMIGVPIRVYKFKKEAKRNQRFPKQNR